MMVTWVMASGIFAEELVEDSRTAAGRGRGFWRKCEQSYTNADGETA